MQFISTIIVALLLAVSTSTVTAAQTSSNLRGGRPLLQEQKLSGPAPSSSGVSLPTMEDTGTAVFPDPNRSLVGGCPGKDYPEEPSFCPMCYNNQICCSFYDSQGIYEFYCSDPVPPPSGVSPSAMEDAVPAIVPDHDRSLIDACPGSDYPMQPCFCPMCRDDETCCQSVQPDARPYCSKNP